ncbi:annexin [Flavobacterium alkalisoli]|uniref:Annexin n=1 Tax=Flavobacterium alkalisoli TaxID=2602769 RepID=A0A5B9FU50_9FLAO|nr:annexin [Flavobacterium alkalisoli]QEE49606.1 annexin [Flavobacterium alkalisoli]
MTKKNKIVLGIVAGLAATVIIYNVVKKKTDISGNGDPTGNGTGSTNPSVPFNANTIAEKLYDAMKNTGTDEDAIFSALRNVTQAQFAQVVAAFKYRSYNSTAGNQINYIPWGDPLPLKDLPYWLKNELSSSDYQKLSLKFPNYL